MRKIPTLFQRDPEDRAHVLPEEWRRIEAAPLYEVSSHGQVRRATAGRGARPGRVLVPQTTEDGYLKIGLRREGGHYGATVHRLVATAFHGPAPTPSHQVNHIDGVKVNNVPSNLEWVTGQENIAHAKRLGLRASKSGQRNGRAKLSLEDVSMAREMLASGSTYQQVAERFGISISQVWNVKSGSQWKAAM